ncbi:hypothetical protein Sgleb_60500 [Streptomyces glebosus]|uniref:6-phosphogluconate dehydrogenase NADP-binding domain-containing protein n=1 Tax=Streptomyces glebosus TaxID=249580 RepID=A0A640T2G9_9ACTN|nr:hypothetical protein Sgleb_60500 [Streptomyces glebosus]GHG46624.1 hypothetical protein GCM10010513_02500 [Streptomyces glebosus]
MSSAQNDPRTPVTVLGLGAMGSALAGAFVRAGHPTTVWNRTPGKADPLVARGAVRADTVAEAVAASPLVIVWVVDYAAAREILEPAGPGLSGRVLVHGPRPQHRGARRRQGPRRPDHRRGPRHGGLPQHHRGNPQAVRQGVRVAPLRASTGADRV